MRRLPAYRLFLFMSGAHALLFTMMSFIHAIYRVEAAHLNPLQLVLLGTALEVVIFIFEVPTGIVADVYSRRLSVVTGYAVIGVAFLLQGSLPFFLPILLGEMIWGLGWTFISGAEDAWLADEIGEERLTRAYLRASQVGRIGSLLGILISSALGTVHLALPILISGGAFLLLSLFLALFMPETGFAPTPRGERNSWQQMGATLRDGLRVVRGRRVLTLILVIGLFFGLSSEGLDRLWHAHLLTHFTFPDIWRLQGPVPWFGALGVASLLLGLVVTETIQQRINVDDTARALRAQFVLNLVMIVAVVVFGVATRLPAALLAIVTVQVFRSANWPLYRAWTNKQIEPRVRATVLSMTGQVDAIGQVLGGPGMGWLATAFSTRVTMVAVAILLSPVLLLYLLAMQWRGGAARQPEAAA
ncbi:MAG: MFS transporter [Anaerolineae bacterium]|nr:MFS transporter [Anaerolineae bacterium]